MLSSLASLSVTLKVKLDRRRLVLTRQLRLEEDRRTKVREHDAQRQVARRPRGTRVLAGLGDELFRFRLVHRDLAFGLLLFRRGRRWRGGERRRLRRRIRREAEVSGSTGHRRQAKQRRVVNQQV